jgi:hypothetical protein
MPAIDPATLDRWRTLSIVDRDGGTVGSISEFYLDRQTRYPTWALVNVGLFGARQMFVPLLGATEIRDGLQVPYEKSHIKDAPRIDLHGELTPDEEATLFAHYGIEYQPATEEAGDAGTPGGAGAGVAGAGAGAAAAAGTTEVAVPGDAGVDGDQPEGTEEAGAAEAGAGVAADAEPAAADAEPGSPEHDAAAAGQDPATQDELAAAGQQPADDELTWPASPPPPAPITEPPAEPPEVPRDR